MVLAYPPFSQIPHGSLLSVAFVVSDPFVDSNAQKKSVLLGCPSRCTPILPAKLRVSGHVTFGKGSVTSKSAGHRAASAPRASNTLRSEGRRTTLPCRVVIALWHTRVRMWPTARGGSLACHKPQGSGSHHGEERRREKASVGHVVRVVSTRAHSRGAANLYALRGRLDAMSGRPPVSI